MKKRYIMPQVCVISGEYECHILAGSVDPSKDSHTTVGGDGAGGNQESSGTESSGSGGMGQGAKEHYNAWDAWED